MNSPVTTATQVRATLVLACVFFLRMFGLFLLLPVLSLYAVDLAGATPVLIGIALGVYGLTQGFLQIPLGMLSDRIGRRPVIVGGLIVFIIGSLIAASASHIYLVILGRALQGAGAIAAAILALLADTTEEEFRTRAMASVGISIGLAFIAAMVLGPVLGAVYGLSGVFCLVAILAAIAIGLLVCLPRVNQKQTSQTRISLAQLVETVQNRDLLPYQSGVFFLHMILMASFVVLPLVLHQHSGLENSEQWKLYLPVLLLSILLMTPFVMRSDKHQAFLVLYPLNIILLLLSQAILLYSHESLAFIATALLIFFVAFNFLEASLPANISKFVATDRKGTALGVFSTCQFFGAFCGGLAGGGAYSFAGFNGVFSLNLLVCLIWIGGVVWYRGTLKSGLRVAIKP